MSAGGLNGGTLSLSSLSIGGVSVPPGGSGVYVKLLGASPIVIPLDSASSISPIYNDVSYLLPYFKTSGGNGGCLVGLDFFKGGTFPGNGNVCFFLSDGTLTPTTGAPIIRVFNMGSVKPLESDPVGDGVYSQYTFIQPVSIGYILGQTGFTTLKLGCQWDGLDETGGIVAIGAVGVQPVSFILI